MNAELWILQAELEHDDAAARDALVRALQIADEQGNLATALRAAVTAALRLGSPTDVDAARETLDVLEGRIPYPANHDWMQVRLARLRTGLDRKGETG
jgi:hypothetical protein